MILFHLKESTNVPVGMAVAIYKGLVVWMGPSCMLREIDTNKWPDGTTLNVSTIDYEAIKTASEKTEGSGVFQ